MAQTLVPSTKLTGWEEQTKSVGMCIGAPRRSLSPEYQALKFTLHRKLLDKINLDALASIETQRLRN
jgi:hypothetical protein